VAGTALSECGTKLHDDKLTQQEACFADYLNTHSKFPLDGLDNLLMGEVSLLAPALDLLREFILVPLVQLDQDLGLGVLAVGLRLQGLLVLREHELKLFISSILKELCTFRRHCR